MIETLRRINRETSLELKVAVAALLLAAVALLATALLAVWLDNQVERRSERSGVVVVPVNLLTRE